ncbi:rCG30195 [Rattus norvegicus]|uniref:RCG30195 n=1 Tax=Rattus norvegicus TaxID=10116 RepID=A6IN16_RAT|nr:rCG30195 [Rattus norvegicus]
MLSSPFSNSDSQFQIPESARGYPRPCSHSEVTRDRAPVYKAMPRSNGTKCL